MGNYQLLLKSRFSYYWLGPLKSFVSNICNYNIQFAKSKHGWAGLSPCYCVQSCVLVFMCEVLSNMMEGGSM